MKPTPIQALMQRAQERPYDPVFIFRNETWTYEMIASEAERLARGMAAHGVKPGDRVAIHMMNRPEYIVAYYACFRLGAIAARHEDRPVPAVAPREERSVEIPARRAERLRSGDVQTVHGRRRERR